MAINFNEVPDSLPNQNALIPEGEYEAVIATAEMKASKTVGRPPYLNMRLDVYKDGAKIGAIFDKLVESDSEYVLYKIGCFCKAINFKPAASLELKDLAKICVGKKVGITVKVGKDNNDNDMSEINLFKNPYYALDTKADAGFMNVPEGIDEDLPFPAKKEEAATSTEEY